MSEIAKIITFHGRVQGVGFRFTAQRTAARYMITGYVRNLPNGSVEMLAQSSAENITQTLRDIKETFKANLTDTSIQNVTPNPRYKDFRITY